MLIERNTYVKSYLISILKQSPLRFLLTNCFGKIKTGTYKSVEYWLAQLFE